jgi:hypothetical protein
MKSCDHLLKSRYGKWLILIVGVAVIACAAIWLNFYGFFFWKKLLRIPPLLAASVALPVGFAIIGILLIKAVITNKYAFSLVPNPFTFVTFIKEILKGIITAIGVESLVSYLSPPFPSYDPTCGNAYNPPEALIGAVIFLGLRVYIFRVRNKQPQQPAGG